MDLRDIQRIAAQAHGDVGAASADIPSAYVVRVILMAAQDHGPDMVDAVRSAVEPAIPAGYTLEVIPPDPEWFQ